MLMQSTKGYDMVIHLANTILASHSVDQCGTLWHIVDVLYNSQASQSYISETKHIKRGVCLHGDSRTASDAIGCTD